MKLFYNHILDNSGGLWYNTIKKGGKNVKKLFICIAGGNYA